MHAAINCASLLKVHRQPWKAEKLISRFAILVAINHVSVFPSVPQCSGLQLAMMNYSRRRRCIGERKIAAHGNWKTSWNACILLNENPHNIFPEGFPSKVLHAICGNINNVSWFSGCRESTMRHPDPFISEPDFWFIKFFGWIRCSSEAKLKITVGWKLLEA